MTTHASTSTELQDWALPQLSVLLPTLDDESIKQILLYSQSLSPGETARHLVDLLGDTPAASKFIASFNDRRSSEQDVPSSKTKTTTLEKSTDHMPSSLHEDNDGVLKQSNHHSSISSTTPVRNGTMSSTYRPHTNRVIEAGELRARDEQEVQNMLQKLQFQLQIYNSEIEPEHDTEYYCNCDIHQYLMVKYNRRPVQRKWIDAVIYPGEKSYVEVFTNIGVFGAGSSNISFSQRNPYRFGVVSPYGYMVNTWTRQRPKPDCHASFIHQTIQLNNKFNLEAQAKIDAQEPMFNIWDSDSYTDAFGQLSVNGSSASSKTGSEKATKAINTEHKGSDASTISTNAPPKISRFSSFRQSIGLKTSEEKATAKAHKSVSEALSLKEDILVEERGRWPDDEWRHIVAVYQDKVGMTGKIADLRNRQPIQYLHLLRAGYFEPIPVAWAGAISNPLKFSIEASTGWRGITPAWRGYEDTAEERLYWVMNHREGSVGPRLKPDFISALDLARKRMASAVEPPPEYFSPNDICHVQHTSDGYSKQVMPPPFRPFDRPEVATDDTMILLDVSGSMDFDPVRPIYDQYLITKYVKSTQPKNKDVAKAVIRRFTDAMSNHDHQFSGYELVTFSTQATHIGTVNHANLDSMWRQVKLGGGTRVMTGWQLVKDLHFQKHSESATHHPVYGWQAGPQTPMLRLLLLLDGEATDMDEFELDLLGLSWAHVTIFLIGVDGCPHHHRHANELQRISDVNHHVSFVDAQGNAAERFVTHELLKRHLGYDISMAEFEEIEVPPAYSV